MDNENFPRARRYGEVIDDVSPRKGASGEHTGSAESRKYLHISQP